MTVLDRPTLYIEPTQLFSPNFLDGNNPNKFGEETSSYVDLSWANFYPCWLLFAKHLILYSPKGDSESVGVKGFRLMLVPHRGSKNENGWLTSSKDGRVGPAPGNEYFYEANPPHPVRGKIRNAIR